MRNYKEFYHVYDLTSIEQTRKDMEKVQNEEKIIVYVTITRDMDEVNEFIQRLFKGVMLDENNLLDEDEEWNVYLLKL